MLISLSNINFSYSHKDEEFSLADVNLEIEKGDFVTILGPNGSGKSTLLKLILGLVNPASGSVNIDNVGLKGYTRTELAKKIAFVPQDNYSVYPFSVFEIVMMGRFPYLNFLGAEKKKDIDKVKSALSLLGISHIQNKGINEISGGEAQRAFIARALVQEPEIMLLDEPNAHLDFEHQLSIFETLQELNRNKNITIIVVSHDLNLAGCYGTRCIFMKEGRIFSDDNKFNLITEENILKVFNVHSKVIADSKNNIINVALIPNKLN